MKVWTREFFWLMLAAAMVLPSIASANRVFDRYQNADYENLSIDHFLDDVRFVGDKVYIEPKMVCVSQKQIFLNVADQLLPIQHLSSDGMGIFVPLDEILMGVGRRTWTCPKEGCGYVNYDGIDSCAICGTNRYAKR